MVADELTEMEKKLEEVEAAQASSDEQCEVDRSKARLVKSPPSRTA